MTATCSYGYCSFIFAIHYGVKNRMAQTKPTSEDLRAELQDLRSMTDRLWSKLTA